MPTQINALLQLFILFLLFIIGCQQGNAVHSSSSSTGISDTTMNKEGDHSEMCQMGEKFEELKKEMKKMKEELTQKLQMKIEEIALKNNKLNEADCGPNLKLLEIFPLDIIILKYSKLVNRPRTGWNTVRAISPISKYNFHDKKITIASYFEMKILKQETLYGSSMLGFCDKQFSLDEILGFKDTNSIGILEKGKIRINGSDKKFENVHGYFKNKDVIGVGIIHHTNSKMECFATLNGKLLGKVELPTEFANIQLFPAVGLLGNGDEISLNFGKHDWLFKEFEQLLD